MRWREEREREGYFSGWFCFPIKIICNDIMSSLLHPRSIFFRYTFMRYKYVRFCFVRFQLVNRNIERKKEIQNSFVIN